mgnify:CR=1 FL=1
MQWKTKYPSCALRDAVKEDVIHLLEEFSCPGLGKNISFSSFRTLWKQNNYVLLHECSNKVNNRLWFNLITEVALEQLFKPPKTWKLTDLDGCDILLDGIDSFSTGDVTSTIYTPTSPSDMAGLLLESIWNLGIIFFLYCFYSSRPSFSVGSQIRLSILIFQELELNEVRMSYLGKFGEQGIRCWLLLFRQNAFTFASYTGAPSLNNLCSYAHNVLKDCTRKSLEVIVNDN